MQPFWIYRPTVLFDRRYILQLWPTPDMTLDAQFNALTRLVLVFTIIGGLARRSITTIGIGAATIIAISVVREILIRRNPAPAGAEAFISAKVTSSGSSASASEIMGSEGKKDPKSLKGVLREDFQPTTKNNPLGNVLLTDIMDDPDRLAAAPAFNPLVTDDINRAVKRQSGPNMTPLIYGDLNDEYDLNASMQRFYTTANTRVGNNQGAFAEYLYGDMHSAKETGPEGAIMREKNSMQYIPGF
jgi:hypothetical protein